MVRFHITNEGMEQAQQFLTNNIIGFFEITVLMIVLGALILCLRNNRQGIPLSIHTCSCILLMSGGVLSSAFAFYLF